MPFRRRATGKKDLYYLDVTYQGRKYTFIAEFIKFNYLKEYWNIHANGQLISLTYHVQTKEVRQDTVWDTRKAPTEFLELLQYEFSARIK